MKLSKEHSKKKVQERHKCNFATTVLCESEAWTFGKQVYNKTKNIRNESSKFW